MSDKLKKVLNLSINTTENDDGEQLAEIDIYGIIGRDYREDPEDQNTKQNIKEKLDEIRDLDVDKIIVNISSIGGLVDHGLVIHDLLAEHDATVETNVKGYVASSATIIAQAGDTRKMSDNAQYLVHRSWGYYKGNAVTLRDRIKDLEKTDDRISNIYAKRSGDDRETFFELMNRNNGDGIWLDADEAKDYGLIDEITEPYEKVAQVKEDQLKNLGLPVPQEKEISDQQNEVSDDQENEISNEEEDLEDSQKEENPEDLKEANQENSTEDNQEKGNIESRNRQLFILKNKSK